MLSFYEKYSELFNERNIRERMILSLCILAALYLLFDFLVFQTAYKKKMELDTRFDVVNTEMTTLSVEEKVLSQALASNPNAKKHREILRLEQRLAELDKQIDALQVGLIPAENLPAVLRELLQKRKNLQLLGMHAVGPEKLTLQNTVVEQDLNVAAKDEIQTVEQGVGVYMHRVVFRVRGKYFDVLNYLADLEKSQWSFYWAMLEYKVDRYPWAVVQMEAYTLSTEKGFIDE